MLASKTLQGIEEKGDKKTKSPDMSSKGQIKLTMTKEQLKNYLINNFEQGKGLE